MAKGAVSTFQRPVFTPRPSKEGSGAEADEITSLLDLIQFNALNNPRHVFCIQAQTIRKAEGQSDGPVYEGTSITFAQLDEAINSCSQWLTREIGQNRHGDSGAPSPVALYMESDVGLFIHLVALQSLDIPVLLISARLSPPNVEHLLDKTNSQTVLVSKRTSAMLNGQINSSFNMVTVEPYTAFLPGPAEAQDATSGKKFPVLVNGARAKQTEKDSNQRTLILHSSGSTGFPKPILHTKRYLLGYAACHQFPPEENIDWVNLSTLPLYHGFGFLAPGLALSLGMTVCFPPSSVIPAGQSTMDLLKTFGCRSLMTVPSIVDDLIAQEGALDKLATLEFLAVGGGALKADQGVRLSGHNVRLLNHYGVTEIGAIAPIFRPGADYNWRYLRLRTDLNLELRPIEDSPRFRLVGYPLGWDETFEVQDELEKNPDAPGQHTEVRILGRTDDVIVLKTGEKIMPQHLESALVADPAIKTAICIGQGSFEPAVLIEPAQYETDGQWESRLVEHVWELISTTNASLDRHARVSSKKAIIIKPSDKPIPRTDKGSISRRQVHEIFADEIEAAYAAMDDDLSSNANINDLDLNDLEGGVHDLVKTVFAAGEGLELDQDFFERGMDSLQAVRLARLLSVAVQRHKAANGTDEGKRVRLSAEFIYRSPSIKSLAGAVRKTLEQPGDGVGTHDRLAEVKALADQWVTGLRERTAPRPDLVRHQRHVVLMTGATGNIGSHMLGQMALSDSVDKIICLYRGGNTSNSTGSKTDKYEVAYSRVRAALSTAGTELPAELWDKIEMVEDAEFLRDAKEDASGSRGTHDSVFLRVAHQVTHIAHLAWPMDFHRTAASFSAHLQMVEALVRLSRTSHALRKDPEQRVRLVFASSIAAIRNYKDKTASTAGVTVVPEEVTDSPAVAAPMGYAEAKWICERMLQEVWETCEGEIDPVIVRIGQISGPEHTPGVWKMGEHMPTLVKASRLVGAFPKLQGTMSWLPVDRAARAMQEILFHPDRLDSVVHVENPTRQPANDIMTIFAHELGVAEGGLMPFDDWLRKAAEVGTIESLSDFFGTHFRDLALGNIVLDTTKARAASATLRGSGGISRDLLVSYLTRWRQGGLFS